MRIYKIDTNLTNQQNRFLLKNISDDDVNLLSSLDIKLSIDLLSESDELSSIVICNFINLEKIKDFLRKNGIEFTTEDITSDFINEENENLNEYLGNLTTGDILKKFGVL